MVHKHHIVPRHKGGTNDTSNLIEVSVEEHAKIHKKLWEENKDKYDYIAWKALSKQLSREEIQRETA